MSPPHSHLSSSDNSNLLLDSTTATTITSTTPEATAFSSFVHATELLHSTVAAEPPVAAALGQRRLSSRIQKLIRIPISVSQTHSHMGSIRLSLGRSDKKTRPSLAAITLTGTPPSFSGSGPTGLTTEVLAGTIAGEAAFAETTTMPTAEEQAATCPADYNNNHNNNNNTNTNTTLLQSPADTLQQLQQQETAEYEHEQDIKGNGNNREGFTVALSMFARVKARVLHHTLHPVSSKISQSSHSSGSSSSADSGTHEGGTGARRVASDGSRRTAEPGIHDNETSVTKPATPPSVLLHIDSDTTDRSCHTNHQNNNNNSNNILDQSSIHTDSTSCHDPADGQDPANDSESTVTDLDEATTTLRHRKYVFEDDIRPEETTVIAAVTVETNRSMVITTAAQEVSTLQAGQDTNTDAVAVSFVTADLPLIAVDEQDAQDPIKLFQTVLTRRHETEAQIEDSLHDLRRLILAYGIPTEPVAEVKHPTTTGPRSSKPSIRAKCWKLLLEVHHVSAQEYVTLVKRGKPEEYGKIRNDTFRTLATDKKFLDVVEEDSLIRVLCAFSWSTQATSPDQSGVSFTYVQGMNVLAAPFLYAMSEMDAFYSYSNFIKRCCPLYVQPTLQGVHCGIKLLEECLCNIDPELYNYLKSKRLSAELYAFPSVLTICACTPPLDQAMQLWDFLLSWGIHLNIICIIAQLHSIRDELMSHASPMKLLRIFPDLDADKIIAETIRMIRLLPDELYDLLVRHPYDPSVAEEIGW